MWRSKLVHRKTRTVGVSPRATARNLQPAATHCVTRVDAAVTHGTGSPDPSPDMPDAAPVVLHGAAKTTHGEPVGYAAEGQEAELFLQIQPRWLIICENDSQRVLLQREPGEAAESHDKAGNSGPTESDRSGCSGCDDGKKSVNAARAAARNKGQRVSKHVNVPARGDRLSCKRASRHFIRRMSAISIDT